MARNDRSAVEGLDEIFAGIDGLLESRVPVARAMGVAMGQVVRDEAKELAPTLAPGDQGWDNQKAGLLKEAIYLAFDNRRSVLNNGLLIYTVSWNAKKAPHGHLVEFGFVMEFESTRDYDTNKWVTPLVGNRRVDGRTRAVGIPREEPLFIHHHPFLGPAFDTKLPTLNGIAVAAGKLAFTEYKKS